MDANGLWYGLMGNEAGRLPPAKILVIGAGSRGNAYSKAITRHTDAVIAAVAEPIDSKRKRLGHEYIWRDREPLPHQQFLHWQQFVQYETDRRLRKASGTKVEKGVDAVLVCTLDEQHAEIVCRLAPFNLHILCEKPLATTLQDCLRIHSSLLPNGSEEAAKAIFGIGHVLRYSPHNMLLRELLVHDRLIGDIISMEHTEPVGWWHFAHSYVRGNWRKESTTAPSLLTKSCHDIDFILWLLCSPASRNSQTTPHLPSKIVSIGSLNHFRASRKPSGANDATNCLTCPVERECKYSAKKIYYDDRLHHGVVSWPVSVVDPEIEECYKSLGLEKAKEKLLSSLEEDYAAKDGPPSRPFFGRCVYESDNDVCDDQYVTITWDDEFDDLSKRQSCHCNAKSATFHMIAHTADVCERRGRIYGSRGEIAYNSKEITHWDFETGRSRIYSPDQAGDGHGGGDKGLAIQFVQAVNAARNGMDPSEAQALYLGCTLDEILRSHALVFAAEDARRECRVIDWRSWWEMQLQMTQDCSPLDEEFEIVSPASESNSSKTP